MNGDSDKGEPAAVIVRHAERPTDTIQPLATVRLQTKAHDREVEVLGEVRIGADEFETDDNLQFEVRLKRAKLKLQLDGYQITQGRRFGDEPYQPKILTEKEKFFSESSASVSGGASMTASTKDGVDAKAEAAAKAKRDLRHEKSSESTNVISSRAVRPKPDDSWEIQPTDGRKFIDDDFMFNERLCDVFPLTGANRRSIALTLTTRQRDLSFIGLRRAGLFKTYTDEQLAKIFLGKKLSGLGPSYRGELELSRAELPEET